MNAPVLKRRRALTALAFWSLSVPAWASNEVDAVRPGVPRVDTSRLPAPGSYRLRRILKAPDGEVLNTLGRSQRLHSLLRGRLTVVSFMYTYCRDPVGCPLAWRAMETVQAALKQDADLAQASQLISLSFDPTNDTPEQMRLYGGERALETRVRWHFLTTASVPKLLPLLRDFGQDVSVEIDDKGRPARTLNHLLKLFLIDKDLQVREIYSVATLEPMAIVNDLRTLLLERRQGLRG